MLNRIKRLWLLAVVLVIWLGSCDILMGLLGGDEDWGFDNENPPVEPDPFDPGTPSFYVNAGGSDSNNGLSESAPFKTLAKAYTAALGSSDRKRVVVLSNLIGTGLVNLDPTGKTVSGTGPITIEGKTAGLKIERSVGADDSVLEIKGGAQIVFKNIKINGKIADIEGTGKNNRALKITGTGTKVTLGNGAVVTGKIATSSGDAEPNDKDGSGILIAGAVVEMTGNSLVTGCETKCETNIGFSDAKGVVVVYDEGKLTMNGGKISGNKVFSSDAMGGGVYVYGSGSFTMNEGAIISGNSVRSYGSNVGGGGVRIHRDGSFIMNGGKISGNVAEISGYGGGVYVGVGSTFVMTGGEISGNSARLRGGGVYAVNGRTFTLSGGVISGNTVTGGSGGGVYAFIASAGSFTMSNCVISDNIAYVITNPSASTPGGLGGGVYVASSGTLSTDSNGKIKLGKGTFTITDCVISGNTAETSGGGVYIADDNMFTMNGGTIYGSNAPSPQKNTAPANKGAAVYNNSNGNHKENTISSYP
jgi:hypothetical protein